MREVKCVRRFTEDEDWRMHLDFGFEIAGSDSEERRSIQRGIKCRKGASVENPGS